MINQHIKDEAIRDRSALQCSFHSKWKLPCSSPLMRQIEAVSKYALDVLAVRPDYILNLKLFKSTVDPKTLCYRAYMEMLDRLIEYAEQIRARADVKREGHGE
jgi:hypothetical protein